MLDGFSEIIEAIANLPKKLIELFTDLFKTLFIPSEDYFTNKFDSIKTKVANKLGFGTYVQLFNSLKNYVAGSIDFGGFIDISIWNDYLPTLQNFIRGFYYVLAIIFNIKMVVWMVRGSSPVKDGGK